MLPLASSLPLVSTPPPPSPPSPPSPSSPLRSGSGHNTANRTQKTTKLRGRVRALNAHGLYSNSSRRRMRFKGISFWTGRVSANSAPSPCTPPRVLLLPPPLSPLPSPSTWSSVLPSRLAQAATLVVFSPQLFAQLNTGDRAGTFAPLLHRCCTAAASPKWPTRQRRHAAASLDGLHAATS